MKFRAVFIKTGYKHILKPLLFMQDPERVHDRFLKAGNVFGKSPMMRSLTRTMMRYDHSSLEQEYWGIHFPNPVGLSAGFDKDAQLVNYLDAIGFGFMQVGTVTLNSYEGNAKPRLVRFPKSQSLLVNFGLKNDGIEAIALKLQHPPKNFPLSLSIGKTNNKKCSTDQRCY